MQRSSYDFDSFEDRSAEARHLAARAQDGLSNFIPTLKSSGLTATMRVLDVGSGTGDRALALAKFLRSGEVVGIDRSQDLITSAAALVAKKKCQNLTLEVADVFAPSSLKPLGRFDFIHMRLVLQHLQEPVQALKNLRSLLVPGGTIFVEDTDRAWMTVVPPVDGWEPLYLRIQKGQAALGGDPYSGRKLAWYLAQAGFEQVTTKLHPVTGGREQVLAWVEHYAPSYLNFLPLRQRPAARKLLDRIKTEAEAQAMFFHQVWFQATGLRGEAKK